MFDFSLITTHTLDIPKDSILDINRILPSEKSVIFEVLYLNSAGYSESHVFEYSIETQILTDHTAYFKSNDSYSLIISMDKKDSDTLVFVSIANTSFTNTIIKSYTYNFNKQSIREEFVFDFNLTKSAYDYTSDCYFYSNDSYSIKRYDPSDDGISTIVTLRKEDIGDSQYIDNFLFSNDYIFIFKNNSDVLAATSAIVPDSSLHILAYETIQADFDLNKIIEQFESKYATNVYITLYDSNILKDILRTKLLSKSDDFDIVFIDDPTESNFFSSIINYELFVPLNNNEQINKNFEEMYPGIYDMVCFNNFIIGIPYYITISNLLSCADNSIIQPEFDFSLKNVWEICEQIPDNGNSSLFSDPYMMLRFLSETIQDQILSENLCVEDIESLLINLKKYYDAGTLFNLDMNGNALGEAKSPVFINAPQFFSTFIFQTNSSVFPENGVVSYPYSEKKYVELNGLAFINKYSANLDSSYNFLALMTANDNIYSTGTSGIYKFTLLGNQLEKNSLYSSLTSNDIAFLSVLPQVYTNTSVYTFDYKSFMAYVRENIMSDFYSGKISPEDAAKSIITFVEYTYFE